MALSTRILFYDESEDYGEDRPVRYNSNEIWGEVKGVSIRTTYQAQSAGVTVEMQAIIWASEYFNQQYALIDHAIYKVESATVTDNRRKLRLLLSRVTI